MGKTVEEIFKALEKLGVRRASSLFRPEPDRETDQETKLLLKARSLGTQSMIWSGDVFARQADFLERVAPKGAPFEAFRYLPATYESPFNVMTMAQLRYYLTWRAGFRYGQTPPCDGGYVEVYLRELCLGTGCEDWQRSELCARLLKSYPDTPESTRRQIGQCLIDLYVISADTVPFWVRMAELGLTRHDFGPMYEYDQRLLPGSFQYALAHTVYDPRSGSYFQDGDLPRLEKAYDAACGAAFDLFAERKVRGDIVLWGRSHKHNTWRPLALPYMRYAPPQVRRRGEVEISPNDRYILEKDAYARKCVSAWLPHFQAVFIGYLLKKCEARMRIYDKYRYRLNPSPVTLRKDMFNAGLRYKQFSELLDSGDFDKALDAAIDLALKPPTKKVKVDVSQLDRIREDAEIVRQKLTVEEEPAPVKPAAAPKPKQAPDQNKNPAPAGSPEERFLAALTPAQKRGVAALLRGETAQNAAEKGVLPQVFWEGVNDAALDALGDTVFDGDGERIYEDYADALRKLLDADR